MKKIIVLTFLSLFIGLETFAQVTIAPTNLFIDNTSRFGTYMVVNGSNQIQEISIDFFFAYSSTDEFGNRTIVSEDSVKALEHSAAESIRAFPQNFSLSPNQRQVVRIRVNMPNDVPDGTYWSRIRTASTLQSPPIELQNADAVTASVGVKVEQVTGLFYKKGSVSTGIEIVEINTSFEEPDNTLSVQTQLLRTGNSPFLGSITTSLLNTSGDEVRRKFVSTTIYFDSIHRADFDVEDLPAGTYTAQVKFETSRNDVSNNDIIKAPTVTKSTTFTIR